MSDLADVMTKLSVDQLKKLVVKTHDDTRTTAAVVYAAALHELERRIPLDELAAFCTHLDKTH